MSEPATASPLHRLTTAIRSLGCADTAWFVGDRLLRRVSRGSVRLVKYYFVAQPVVASAKESGLDGRVRIYVAEGVDEVITQAPRPSHVLQERFRQRSRCVVAERNGQLAGFIWVCPEGYREDVLRCEYRWTPVRSAAWDFDVFIDPAFRMGRLFSRLWSRTHALLDSEGVRWTLSRIDAFNPASLASHRRLGARQLAQGWFLILGPVQLSVASVPPYCHLSIREASVPTLRFDLADFEHRAAKAG